MLVREAGTGPSVLLLHGTPSPAADWEPLVEALRSEFRVLVPELPGYGGSPPLDNARLELVGDAIAAMLADRDAGELRAVVGFSTGAWRALDLVLRARVRAEVVISLGGVATFDQPAREFRRAVAARLVREPEYLASSEVSDLMRELMLSSSWRSAHPQDADRVARWPLTTTATALSAELVALAEMRDLRPELASLDARLYARVGALDAGCPPAWSEDMVRHAPRAALDIVPGCGHALLIEDREPTIAAVRAQLSAAE